MPRREAPKLMSKSSSSSSDMTLESCPVCPVQFSKALARRRHIRAAHPEYDPTATSTPKPSEASPECGEWVSCGTCSVAVATRGELIRHVESRHMMSDCDAPPDKEVVKLGSLEREEMQTVKIQMKQASKGCQWVEHMYVDRTVNRCKGTVGRPYLQSIGGEKVKVQKICPATIIIEPSNGAYEVTCYWKHIGHDALVYKPDASMARYVIPPRDQLCEKVKTTLQNVIDDVQFLSDVNLKLLFEKAEELEQYVSSMKETRLEPIEEVILPSPNQPSRKRIVAYNLKVNDTNETSQKSNAEKAVDDALQKYIKAKNPVIKIQPLEKLKTGLILNDSPKIADIFSSNDEDELDDFVKDVEHLVNNGKSYEAVENKSKLGKAVDKKVGDKNEEQKKKDVTEQKKKDATETSVRDLKKETKDKPHTGMSTRTSSRNVEVKVETPRVKAPQTWSKSSFNDTYKDFITKEFQADIGRPPKKRQKINPPEVTWIDTVSTTTEKNLSLEISADGMNKSNSEIPETVKNMVKLKRGRPLKKSLEASLSISLDDIPVMENQDEKLMAVPVMSVTETPVMKLTKPPTKKIKETPAMKLSETSFVQSETTVTIQTESPITKPQIKKIKETPVLTPVEIPIMKSKPPMKKFRETPVTKLRETPVMKLRETPVTKLRETPVMKLRETPIMKLRETPVTKLRETPVMKLRETSVTKLTETPIAKLTKPPTKKIRESSFSKLTETPVMKLTKNPELSVQRTAKRLSLDSQLPPNLPQAKSRTGLKSKMPTMKPKSKMSDAKRNNRSYTLTDQSTDFDVSNIDDVEQERTPAKKIIDSFKNEEFIVKEQDDDVNILIIRM